jgi:hypothetical protein
MNSIIQKALSLLEEGNYVGYFEEMDNVVPKNMRTPYQEHKGKFMAGQAPYNFHQMLEVFAREVEKALENPSKNTFITENNQQTVLEEFKLERYVLIFFLIVCIIVFFISVISALIKDSYSAAGSITAIGSLGVIFLILGSIKRIFEKSLNSIKV